MAETNSLAAAVVELQELLAKCTPLPWEAGGGINSNYSLRSEGESFGLTSRYVDVCLIAAAINALPDLLSALTTTEQDEAPACICGLPMSKNPHPDAGKPERLLDVGAEYVCIACTRLALHKATTYRYAAESARDEARAQSLGFERKGMQLCGLAGSMLLACQRIKYHQDLHATHKESGWPPCRCDFCQIILPDISAETVRQLALESNTAHAQLLAVQHERDALRTKIEKHISTEQEALNADCATDPCAAYHRGTIWAFKTVLSVLEQKEGER